ncbi:MAG: sulfur carrier protein ThiS [Candidatus Omnitrophica bacterium]|nr:sulfur carrier protein ThiS [Candidatus Omnitrophota bacterium]
MRININGKSEEIKKSTLGEIIAEKGLCQDNLVLEHNKRIIPKEEWQDIILKENDVVEIVSFVGGG